MTARRRRRRRAAEKRRAERSIDRSGDSEGPRSERILTFTFAFVVPVAVALLGAIASISTTGAARVLFALIAAAGCFVLLWDAVMIGVFARVLSAIARGARPPAVPDHDEVAD